MTPVRHILVGAAAIVAALATFGFFLLITDAPLRALSMLLLIIGSVGSAAILLEGSE